MTATDEKRQTLIHMAKGGVQRYCIDYCIDVKGNITILGGDELPITADADMFSQHTTEDYLWLFDGWKKGKELTNKERENAAALPRETLIAAYLNFRKEHPTDGYGFMAIIDNCVGNRDGLRDGSAPRRQLYRDDIADVWQELKRRNREYIKELYGITLPIDYDFKAAYDEQIRPR